MVRLARTGYDKKKWGGGGGGRRLEHLALCAILLLYDAHSSLLWPPLSVPG